MKERIKKWLHRATFIIILICSIITCINSFDNSREYYAIEVLDMLELQENSIMNQLDSIMVMLESLN